MRNSISQLYRSEQDAIVGEVFDNESQPIYVLQDGTVEAYLRYIYLTKNHGLRDVTFLIEGILGERVKWYKTLDLSNIEDSINGVLGRTVYLKFVFLDRTT